jgi:hypothetical protein
MYLFHRYNPLDVYKYLMIKLHSPGVEPVATHVHWCIRNCDNEKDKLRSSLLNIVDHSNLGIMLLHIWINPFCPYFVMSLCHKVVCFCYMFTLQNVMCFFSYMTHGIVWKQWKLPWQKFHLELCATKGRHDPFSWPIKMTTGMNILIVVNNVQQRWS